MKNAMIEKPIISRPPEDVDHNKKVGGKKENLKQRAYLNTVSSMMDYAANRLTGLFVNPFIIAGLGTSLFGIWQMLGQFTGYVNIADTRSSQVLKWTVAQKKDVATGEELRSDAGAAFVVMLFVMPVVLIAGSIIAWYAPYNTHAEKAHYGLIRIACSLLIFSVLVFKFFELFIMRQFFIFKQSFESVRGSTSVTLLSETYTKLTEICDHPLNVYLYIKIVRT
jgi:O-antigen/teichoic acid export membrane protein